MNDANNRPWTPNALRESPIAIPPNRFLLTVRTVRAYDFPVNPGKHPVNLNLGSSRAPLQKGPNVYATESPPNAYDRF